MKRKNFVLQLEYPDECNKKGHARAVGGLDLPLGIPHNIILSTGFRIVLPFGIASWVDPLIYHFLPCSVGPAFPILRRWVVNSGNGIPT